MIASSFSRLTNLVSRVPPIETAVFVIAIAVLTAVFSAQHEAAPNFDSYSSYDASAGGYRALYELLEREGLHVDRFERRAAFLDDSIHTLVYAEPLSFVPAAQTGPSGEADARALETWVRSGGKLVYFGHDDAAAKAKLLDLPFSMDASKHRTPERISASLEALGVARIGPVKTALRWMPRTHAARNAAFHVLYDDGRGAVAVAYPFGKGNVTAVIDETLLDDANIATGDRARFALALVRARGTENATSFDETAHGYLVPEHWYSIVPRPFVYAVVVASLALLIAFFGAAIRFGPAIVPETIDDRTSSDFIDALSTLFERGKARRKTIGDAVHSTSRAMARSLGIPGDPSGAEIAARIADQERRIDFETMLALANEPVSRPDALLRVVALAQRLRKDAVSHGR